MEELTFLIHTRTFLVINAPILLLQGNVTLCLSWRADVGLGDFPTYDFAMRGPPQPPPRV
jgi:hypothetical protein